MEVVLTSPSRLNHVLFFYCWCLEMDRTWMYKARRTDAYFRGEVDKFIQAVKTYARIEKTQMIHCPCRTCKNLRVFSNTTIIRSHVLISGFVDNYMIWNKHGEEEQPQRDNSIDNARARV